MARALGEHVHDQTAEIEQHPIAAGFAFAVQQAACRCRSSRSSISSQMASTCRELKPVQSRK